MGPTGVDNEEVPTTPLGTIQELASM